MTNHDQSWQQLFVENQGALYGYFYRKAETRPVADDLVQEVFMAAWQARDRYREHELPRVMTGIARNKWRNYCRTASRYSRKLDDYRRLHVAHPGPTNSDLHELAALLPAAIDQLPSTAASVTRMRYLEGLSIQQVALAHAMTECAVSCLLYRARRKLKRILVPPGPMRVNGR